MLVETWCLTSAKATGPAPERSRTGGGPVLGCSQPKFQSLKAAARLLMTRRWGGGCRDLRDRSWVLNLLLPSLPFEPLLPSCVQAPRRTALPLQGYPLRCCEEATPAWVHQHSPVQPSTATKWLRDWEPACMWEGTGGAAQRWSRELKLALTSGVGIKAVIEFLSNNRTEMTWI